MLYQGNFSVVRKEVEKVFVSVFAIWQNDSCSGGGRSAMQVRKEAE